MKAAFLSPFVGRSKDVDEIESFLAAHRLVTIVGAAGMGKTRLAREVVARIGSRFKEGAKFIDVSPLTDASLVAPAIAALLRPGIPVDGTDADSLAFAIGDRELLLVVDDCDHLADAIAKVLTTFLHGSSKLRVLATSREPLGAAGERVYRLQPLGPPDALALFGGRSTARDNAALICRALAGVPLAIEVAASRTASGTQELIEHPVVAAQASNAALEWSYSRLSDEERRVFRALAVLAGGFTIDAAVQVCSRREAEYETTRAHLFALTDRALIAPADDRYRLLEPVREFALARLRETDELDGVARRHAQAFDRLAERAYDRLYDVQREAWIRELVPELANIRAALVWSLDKRNDSHLGARIVGNLGAMWREIGLPVEGLRRALQAAVQVEDDARLWLSIAFIRSTLWMLPREQLEAAERAMALYEITKDPRGRAEALVRIGRAYAFMRRRGEAEEALGAAIGIAEEIGKPRMVTLFKYEAAIAATQCDDFEGAKRLYAEVHPRLNDDGERRFAAVALMNFAEVEFATGNPERAIEHLHEVDAIATESVDRGTLKSNMTAYLTALDRREEAIATGREGLRLMRLSEDRVRIVFLLQHLAAALALAGEVRRGARLLGFTAAQYATYDVELEFTERYTRDRLQQAIQATLEPTEIEELAREGSLFTTERAAEEALRDP